jgi:ABC-2 type transport system ATP-binding protein
MSSRRALVSVCIAALLLALAPVAAADEHEPGDGEPAGEVRVTRQVVESFDGTPIVTNLFLPAGISEQNPAELVLETHGWGGTGRTSPGGTTGELVADGYAVLTWDQRGFGCSGGQVRINDPQVEGHDVSALIDWAVDNAPIARGDDGEPIVGMIGGSYAGAIQTAAASIDPRIDAIAPDMSWSDLRYSLYPGEVVKQGWVTFLYALGTATAEGEGLNPECDEGPQPGAGLDPIIHRGVSEFVATGKVSGAVLDFFAGSSLDAYSEHGTNGQVVDIPTLVTQSAIDTLFNLTDGLGVHEHVLDQGVDSRLLIYCGGHVNCPTTYAEPDTSDSRKMRDAIHDWFAVHLRGEERDLGPRIEYRTNEGEWRGLDDLPTTDGRALEVAGAAENLVVVPVLDVPDLATTFRESGSSGGSLQATPLTAAAVSDESDPRAATFEVARAEEGPLELVGVPEVELTVDGTLLETLEQLPADTLAEVLEELSLHGLEPVTDEAGEVIGTAPVAGNILQGAAAGLLGPTAADAVPTDIHLFAKLVHRESGEVVNLQEGAIRVPLADGPAAVSLRMPGLAYTIPEGDHLDLQISTASLVHATGRLPALVDVALEAAVPAVGLDAGDPIDDGPGGPPEGRPGGPPEQRPGGPPEDHPGAPEHRAAGTDRVPAGQVPASGGSPAGPAATAAAADSPIPGGAGVLALLVGALMAVGAGQRLATSLARAASERRAPRRR